MMNYKHCYYGAKLSTGDKHYTNVWYFLPKLLKARKMQKDQVNTKFMINFQSYK